MLIHLTLRNVAGGRFFLASGKRRPDCYRFERVNGQEHLHRMTITGEEAETVLPDLALRLQQIDIPVDLTFELEANDTDGAALVSKLQEEILSLSGKLADEQEKTRQAESKAAPATAPANLQGRRITDEEVEMLGERDELIEALEPYAQGDESPIQCLCRLLPPQSKPAPPAEPQVTKPKAVAKKTPATRKRK